MPTLYLVIIAILGWGVGSIFYKIANDNIHPIMVTTIVTAIYVLLTPLAFLVIKFPKDVSSTGLINSVLGGLCMAVGSLAYFYALKKGGSGEITTLTALYPAVTMVLSVIFLHEDLSFRKAIGVSLALISFFILSWK